MSRTRGGIISMSSRPDPSFDNNQLLDWLRDQLNRAPEPFDLYQTAKALYQEGSFVPAARLLQSYVDGPNTELPGLHLLGYAKWRVGDKKGAIDMLRRVANSGFDQDWQLLVELRLDVDAEESQARRRRLHRQLVMSEGRVVPMRFVDGNGNAGGAFEDSNFVSNQVSSIPDVAIEDAPLSSETSNSIAPASASAAASVAAAAATAAAVSAATGSATRVVGDVLEEQKKPVKVLLVETERRDEQDDS